MEVNWETPPDNVRLRVNWDMFVAQLKERPGEWARLPGIAHGVTCSRLRRAGCDVAVKTDDSGVRRAWARHKEGV